jgi:hypothetical protein
MRFAAMAIPILLLGSPALCPAQAELGPWVFAGGGGLMSNGTYAAAGTIGQSVIGRSVGATYAASAGFWGDGGVIVEVEESVPTGVPEEFALRQNYPNPFNPSTQIAYQIPAASHVRLALYDLLGREVTLLVDEQKAAGRYTVQLNAAGLASGPYVYRMTAGGFLQARRMMLVR